MSGWRLPRPGSDECFLCRLSLAPETPIDNHRVRAPLPALPRLPRVDSSEVAQRESEGEEEVRRSELWSERSERSSESEGSGRSKTPGAKRGRKSKTEMREIERKKVKSGEGAEEVSREADTGRTATGAPEDDQRFCPESKVFGR